jgi:hypothetical protein
LRSSIVERSERSVRSACDRGRMADQNDLILSRAPPCFRRHVKLLVPAAFAVVSIGGGLTSGRRPVVKIIAESLSQHDEKPVVPTPLSRIKVGRSLFIFNLLTATSSLKAKPFYALSNTTNIDNKF